MRILSRLILGLILLLAACAPRSQSVEIRTAVITEAPTATAYEPPQKVVTLQAAGPTPTPYPGATPPADQTPTSVATSAPPTPGPTPPPPVDPAGAHPLAGLTFSTGQDLWRVSARGEPVLVVDAPYARLSADGYFALFTQEMPDGGRPDVWLSNLISGEMVNLTATSGRSEEQPRFWPGRAGQVFFVSDVEFGMESSAYPSLINLDGSGYTVFDEEMGGPYALSPRGDRFIYGGYGPTARIFTFGAGITEFNPAAYGFPVLALIEPAWSPDGSTLAWLVSLRSGGNLETGVLLLDLEAKIGTLMHTFQPQGGGSPPSLAFSPDGNTITHAASDVSSGQMRSPTVWVLAADGSGGFNLPNCTNPTWSPDSARLACLRLGASGQMEVVLFAAADGQEVPLNFNPPGGILMLQDWLVPLAWE